jgi:hypothetical protein
VVMSFSSLQLCSFSSTTINHTINHHRMSCYFKKDKPFLNIPYTLCFRNVCNVAKALWPTCICSHKGNATVVLSEISRWLWPKTNMV